MAERREAVVRRVVVANEVTVASASKSHLVRSAAHKLILMIGVDSIGGMSVLSAVLELAASLMRALESLERPRHRLSPIITRVSLRSGKSRFFRKPFCGFYRIALSQPAAKQLSCSPSITEFNVPWCLSESGQLASSLEDRTLRYVLCPHDILWPPYTRLSGQR